MSLRHKVVVAALEAGQSADWNDDHIISFAVELEEQLISLGPVLTSQWDFTDTVGGANPIWTLVGAAGSGHAFVVFNTGGVTGQVSAMKHELGAVVSNITSPDDLPILTFAMQIAAIHNAGTVVEMGFFNNAVAIFTANQDGAYFRITNNNVFAVTGDGAAETTTDLGVHSEYAHYRIEFLTASVKFYVDDMVTAAATHAANLPDTDLTVMFGVVSANNVDSTIRLDGASLLRLRKV